MYQDKISKYYHWVGIPKDYTQPRGEKALPLASILNCVLQPIPNYRLYITLVLQL